MSEEKILKLEGIVRNLERSRIPNIYIATIDCGDNTKIIMDVHRRVKIFDIGDKLSITISTSIPQYEEGKDFLARGYVYSKKTIGDIKKLLISLWGFLVVIETKKDEIYNKFNYMDEIYLHIKNIGRTL